MEDLMSSIDVETIHTRKAQWTEVSANLQTRLQELNRELFSVQKQLDQISGAIQACDVILAEVQSQPQDTSTLEQNG